jgi:acyl-CoA reductase-like NAD-dependent aldehyde dehydrogenase
MRNCRIARRNCSRGAFYRPSLLEIEQTDVSRVQQELFGPLATFEVFDDDRMVCLVIQALSGETKNRTALAMSAGSPSRPNGTG